ncbi:MAG: PAS domain S-box protein [Candidatus Hydrogenedentes bacterium]|nr:PAS domain S-box protein [Candidatus Hydrogenedentota bacterium]
MTRKVEPTVTSPAIPDIETLAQAFELLTATTQKMEEAYRLLEARLQELDRELADKNRELAITSDYLSNLLESMSDGVIAVDNEGRITRFNRAACSILGYSANDVLGNLFEQVFGRPFDAPRLPGSMELVSRSGRRVPVNERDSPIADMAQRRLGTVKTFQDLSEIIALREQVRQIDRLAAIGEMAATVAHEIRNPLGGIRGFAAFLAQDIPETDPRRRLVDKILQGAKSLEKVVNELLAYTRPVELELRPTPCTAIVQAAQGFLDYDGGRIQMVDSVSEDYRVLADTDKMGQVILNLLLNAVQSIEGKGEIRIEARADDHYVLLNIHDTGCGMDEAHLARAFSPFFTTKEKGSGLGLAICQKIVEGHGGTLNLHSIPGRGSVATVRLPRAE